MAQEKNIAEEISMTAFVDAKTAKKFDKIAEGSFRSRAQHLKFIIDKEIEFHETKRDS